MTPRIGLWGPFDQEDLDGVLAIRVAQAELRRRLPAAEAPAYSPAGDRPRVMDPERPLRPLGPWSLERAARLAEQLDTVVVVGGLQRADGDSSPEQLNGPRPDASEAYFVEGLGTELEVVCPVLWHAIEVPGDLGAAQASRARVVLAHRPYVSVRDEVSRRRLEAAGVEREIAVVPHPALLAPRCFSSAICCRPRPT